MLFRITVDFSCTTTDSGQQLKQDDPSALKDIIEIVQGKVSTKDSGVK